MMTGRVLGAAAATAALVGCAVVISQFGGSGHHESTGVPAAVSIPSSSIYQPPPVPTAMPTKPSPRVSPVPRATSTHPSSQAPRASSLPPSSSAAAVPPAATRALPVAGGTADAQQVITVAAPSWGATRASLQAWNRNGSGWTKIGSAVSAWLGYAGMSTNAREGFNGTPVGSFGLTQAFGNFADPGTPMPYFEATANDWWDGDSTSATYNSHQRCAPTNCRFRTSESENLHDADWVYGYAVVIDYNMSPMVPGKGSAFFLHITENKPTQGCVSIPQPDLVRILHWLDPAKHPRIIMGVG